MYERIGRKPGSVEPSILFEREQGATMPFVSIKAINFDQFLRHQNFLAELQPIDPADDLAKNDATFDMVPGLADPNNPNLFSFAAVNSTLNGFFLRHQDFRLTLQQQPPSAPLGGENSPEFNLFNSDATFIHSEEIPLNWNTWVRQIHHWLSIAFTVAVIINIVALVQKEPAVWVGLLALLPLALLLLTGLYLFVLPHAAKWRSG